MSKVILLLLVLVLVLAVATTTTTTTCDSITNNSNLPCIDIKSCDDSANRATIVVDKLSDGKGASLSSSSISLCYDNDGININTIAYNQLYYNGNYTNCNDGIFYLDVNEVFIAPSVDSDNDGPHCYNEIDMSPNNIMYEAGIYNPNLNKTGLINKLFDCSSSGIIHESDLDLSNSVWSSKLLIPWSVVHCPHGCTLSSYKESCSNKDQYGRVGNMYRVNFYRINEIVSTKSCSSGYSSPQTCEYNAWSPNNVYPPSFHEPKYFGYLILN